MSARLGLVHTVPALADSLTKLAAELADDVELVHVVDPSLLARAVAGGVSDDVSDATAAHVGYLAGLGVDAVLVTCSSIGACADLAAVDVDVPVLRIDRPMARRAVEIVAAARGRVSALATLTSTLTPTERLLRDEARAQGAAVEVRAQVVEDAAAARSAGDQQRHDELVRQAVQDAAEASDVVVLAQASMADAAADVGSVPVLNSPRSGLEAALATLRRR